MDIKFYEEEAYRWIEEGADYQEVKNRLAQKALSNEDTKAILKKVDNYLLQLAFYQQKRANALAFMIFGGAALIIGLYITLGSFVNGKSWRIITYGAIITGAWALYKGYQRYNAPMEEISPRELLRKRKMFERF
jgi:hypothetical protein